MSLRIFKQIHRTSCSKIPFADFIKFFIWLFDWSPITPHRHFSLKGNITDCTGCNRRGSLGRWRRADCRRATLSGCQSKRKRYFFSRLLLSFSALRKRAWKRQHQTCHWWKPGCIVVHKAIAWINVYLWREQKCVKISKAKFWIKISVRYVHSQKLGKSIAPES